LIKRLVWVYLHLSHFPNLS